MAEINITLCSSRPSSGANPSVPVLVQPQVPKDLPQTIFSCASPVLDSLLTTVFEFYAPPAVGNTVSPVIREVDYIEVSLMVQLCLRTKSLCVVAGERRVAIATAPK